jgi:hypothetical protein
MLRTMSRRAAIGLPVFFSDDDRRAYLLLVAEERRLSESNRWRSLQAQVLLGAVM